MEFNSGFKGLIGYPKTQRVLQGQPPIGWHVYLFKSGYPAGFHRMSAPHNSAKLRVFLTPSPGRCVWSSRFVPSLLFCAGSRGSMVEALHYKMEGRGFDT